MEKAIGYVRVSTREQGESGVSIPDQKGKIKQYCEFKGYELDDIVIDNGVSGSNALKNRPGGQEVFSRLEGDIDIVIGVRLDRLFRDVIDCLTVTRELDDRDIALHLLDFGGGQLDTTSSVGRLFITMASAFAEFERNQTSERTKNALQYKKENGEVYGPTPVGYERDGDELVKNEEELEAVKIIHQLRDEGLSMRKIAEHLNELGVRTKRGGAKWYASTVNYILKNDIYEGVQAV